VTDNDDTMNAATTIGAADDETTVVPNIHPTQAAPELAWSNEDETDELHASPTTSPARGTSRSRVWTSRPGSPSPTRS
jgi:hypothetical protein